MFPIREKEKEEHYYKPAHSGLIDLGLKPHPMTDEVLTEMLDRVRRVPQPYRRGKSNAARTVVVNGAMADYPRDAA